MNIFHLEMDSLKFSSLVVGDRGDEVLDAGNEDLAVRRHKLGHYNHLLVPYALSFFKIFSLTESDKVSHGFVDGTAKDTRVEIPVRTRNLDLVIVDTSETIRETRGLGVKPIVVYSALSASTNEKLD